MFDAKNVRELGMGDLNQCATYLGDRIGRLGFIVTRHRPEKNILRKQIAIFNDSQPRKVLLVLTDHDLAELVKVRVDDGQPAKWLQRHYRNLRTKAQWASVDANAHPALVAARILECSSFPLVDKVPTCNSQNARTRRMCDTRGRCLELVLGWIAE
jgi:hypothetical protein